MTDEPKPTVEQTVCDIRRQTRKKYSAEEKVRIVLEGLRGHVLQVEQRISGSGQAASGWGDTKCEADSTEVNDLRSENEQLKAVVAEPDSEQSQVEKKLAGPGNHKVGRLIRRDETEKSEIIHIVELYVLRTFETQRHVH